MDLDFENYFDITSFVQKLNIPGFGNEPRLTCYTDDDGTSKCFTHQEGNSISCNGDSCFVNYKTLNQRLLGNGKKIKDLDLDVLIQPGGLSTVIQLVGVVPRKKLRTLRKIIGNVTVEETGMLPSIVTGMPNPPPECHVNPFKGDCTKYLASDDYTYIPMIGFKKKTELMTNPGSILKSEVFPQIKNKISNFIQVMRTRKDGKNGGTTRSIMPVHQEQSRAMEINDKKKIDR